MAKKRVHESPSASVTVKTKPARPGLRPAAKRASRPPAPAWRNVPPETRLTVNFVDFANPRV